MITTLQRAFGTASKIELQLTQNTDGEKTTNLKLLLNSLSLNSPQPSTEQQAQLPNIPMTSNTVQPNPLAITYAPHASSSDPTTNDGATSSSSLQLNTNLLSQLLGQMAQPSHPNPTHHSSGQGEVDIVQKFLGLQTSQPKGKETPKKDQELTKREQELARREKELAKREKDQNDFKLIVVQMLNNNNRDSNNASTNQQPAQQNDRQRNFGYQRQNRSWNTSPNNGTGNVPNPVAKDLEPKQVSNAESSGYG